MPKKRLSRPPALRRMARERALALASGERRSVLPLSDDPDDEEQTCCCDACRAEMELTEVWIEGKGFVYKKDADKS